MKIEHEATFSDIDKNFIRKRLREVGAELIREEFTQKRFAFKLPKGNEIRGGWVRVRDEGNKITMSIKIVDGGSISSQKEVCLEVNDFDSAVCFVESLGCEKKAYQETKRELWKVRDVEITIDEWPFLEPFLEIEANTEEEVKEVVEKLGLNYEKALFCAVDTLYSRKYGIKEDIINNHTPRIVFGENNPFI